VKAVPERPKGGSMRGGGGHKRRSLMPLRGNHVDKEYSRICP
jgi:hypothetical protein